MPTFFAVHHITNCPFASVQNCSISAEKLPFDFDGALHNEPWSVYYDEANDLIYGVDMYNVAQAGTEQEEGTLLIWDTNDLNAMPQKIEFDDNTGKVGMAPRDVLVTPNGKIFVSNSGTHEISNKQDELNGIPFDYSSVVGVHQSLHVMATTALLVILQFQRTILIIIAGIVIVIIIIFIVIKNKKRTKRNDTH